MGQKEIFTGEPEKKNEVEIFLHKAGWIVNGEPNSPDMARLVFARGIKGCEVDLRCTEDGAVVVTHDSMKGKTLEQFLEENPRLMTLESWIEWLSGPELEGKSLYLDLKDDGIDPFHLVNLVGMLGDRVVIGTKNPDVALKALLARKLLGVNTRVILQIPDPVIPSVAVRYARNIARKSGLVSIPLGMNESDLIPDGVHFYYAENGAKYLWSEKKGHGEFVPVTDKEKPENAKGFPNIFGFHNLQRVRLRQFVQLAKASGFKYVFAASAESAQTNRRMIEWGVDAIMPNNPDVIPESLKVEMPEGGIELQKPSSRNKFTRDLTEGVLIEEAVKLSQRDSSSLSELERVRMVYLEIAKNLTKTGFIRTQFGF